MSYYTGVGDYYSGKGDPGLLSAIGSVVGTVGKIASNLVPIGGGLVRTATGAFQSATATRNRTTSSNLHIPSSIPAIPKPGVSGAMQRLIPGGQSGYSCGSGCGSGYHLDKRTQSKCVRNRKVNYTNPKALSRAAKRMDGFVTVARRALKTTNYKVVSKSYKQNWRKPLKR